MTDYVDNFHKEINKSGEKHQRDANNFAEVLEARAYDPFLRIQRSQNWEQMIIQHAWYDDKFKNTLLNGEQKEIQDTIISYLNKIFKEDNIPRSYITDTSDGPQDTSPQLPVQQFPQDLFLIFHINGHANGTHLKNKYPTADELKDKYVVNIVIPEATTDHPLGY